MDNLKVEIKKLDSKYINEIAQLTYDTKGFAMFVSKLGLNYMKNIYFKNILEIGAGFCAFVDGVFAGFIICTEDSEGYYDYVTSKRRFNSLPYMFLFGLKHPLSFLELVKYKFFLKDFEEVDINAEITLFVVKPEYRSPAFYFDYRISITEMLMNEALKLMKSKNIEKVKLEVPADNKPAKAFYKALKFYPFGEINFGKVTRTIYVKDID